MSQRFATNQISRCSLTVLTDPEGEYIKKYIPQLKNYPKKFIYEPWKAPKVSQKEWGCVIGKQPSRASNKIFSQYTSSRQRLSQAHYQGPYRAVEREHGANERGFHGIKEEGTRRHQERQENETAQTRLQEIDATARISLIQP